MKAVHKVSLLLVGTHILVASLAYLQGSHSARQLGGFGAVGPSRKGVGRTADVWQPRSPSNHRSDGRTAQAHSRSPGFPPLLSSLAATEQAIRGLRADELVEGLHEVSGRPPGPERLFSQQLMLGRLTEIDPQLALGFANTLTGTDRETSTLTVLSTWTRLDPEAASTHFQENLADFGAMDNSERLAARTIAAQWAAENPADAFEWAKSLPEEVRLDALAPAIASLSLQDTDRVITAINERDPGYERTEMISQVAKERGREMPQETAAWVNGLTDPEEQSGAAGALVSSWASRDLNAAAQWVRSLPSGTTRDAAVRALLDGTTFRQDPGLALRWTDSIHDPSLRREIAGSIVSRWEVLDPPRAAAWMQSAGRSRDE